MKPVGTAGIDYPKFVWVCEFSTYFIYTKEEMVNGEVILDATAFSEAAFNSIISVRIGQYIGYRSSSEEIDVLFERLGEAVKGCVVKYLLYRNNVKKGGLLK